MGLDQSIMNAVNSASSLDAAAQYLNSIPNGTTLSDTMQGTYLAASSWRSKLDPSIVSELNTIFNANPDVNLAWGYLRSLPNNMTVAEEGLYIAGSEFAASSTTTNGSGSGTNTNSSTGIQSLMQIPTMGASILGMVGLKAGSPAVTQVGTGILAAVAQYEVFDRAEKAAEKAVTANIAMLGGIWLAAIGATMLWLSKLSSYTPAHYGTIMTNLPTGTWVDLLNTISVGVKAHGLFTIHLTATTILQFWFTVAVATAITSAVLAAGILAGLPGSSGDTTPTGAAVAAALAKIPAWYDTLPSAAVAMISTGLMVSGSAQSLSPNTLFQQFSVPESVAQIEADNGSSGASIFVQPYTQTTGGYDTVYVVTPGANGNSTVSVFQVDSNGYLIGANGPATNYRPIASPIVSNTGTSTDYTINQDALNAIYQIPACTAIANDRSYQGVKREEALNTCLRNNKLVQFIPIAGS